MVGVKNILAKFRHTRVNGLTNEIFCLGVLTYFLSFKICLNNKYNTRYYSFITYVGEHQIQDNIISLCRTMGPNGRSVHRYFPL